MSAVRVRGREDQRLSWVGGIDVLGQLLADDPCERAGDDSAVEALDLEAKIVWGRYEVDLTGERIKQRQLGSFDEMDAVAGQLGLDAGRRLLVHEPSINHRLAQTISEDRATEDLGSMQCRRGCQADADGIEVLDDTAILADIVVLGAEPQLGVAHLAIERVAAVALVDEHQVILVDRGHVLGRGREQHAFDQALDGADVDLSVQVGRGIPQHLETEDVREGSSAHNACAGERVFRLLPEGGPVYHKADSAEAPRVQETIQERHGELRLARPRSHGEQERALTVVSERRLYGLDAAHLVVA